MPKPGHARKASGKQKSTAEPASPVRIGLVAGEPIRVEGLRSIFDQPAAPGHPSLCPVVGAMQDLLANHSIEFLVVDLNSSTGSLETLQSVRRARPDVRQIVIGPENDEELVLDCVVAGARAYLDSSASPETVRQAIEIVVSGSIWAPRKLLSRLIDRLLGIPRSMVQRSALQLSEREQQVLELILLARSNREIASQLGIEERTVKAHVGRLLKKTGSDNRIDLSMRAINRSLVPGRQLPSR
jgi:DNA-binding NarL/FixJ family response regulator